MNATVAEAEKRKLADREINFSPGDTVLVSMKIREGDKERVQPYQGVVVQIRGRGRNRTFTVRKASGGVYVERVFPLASPLLADIKVLRRGKVRRARLFYLRGRRGKATRIDEKRTT